MSGFILGMLHLREISGKAVPFCSVSEYPPVVSVSEKLLGTEKEGTSGLGSCSVPCLYLNVTVRTGWWWVGKI